MVYEAGCHCGNMDVAIHLPASIESAIECNCSICSASGYLHVIVAADQVKFRSWGRSIIVYRFNTLVAEHYVCAVCGVKPIYRPRSHPTGYSVNARCIRKLNIDELRIQRFDGSNWEMRRTDLREGR